MPGKERLAEVLRAGFESLVVQAGEDPRALAALSVAAVANGRPERAYALAREARALAPDDPEIAGLTQRPLTAGVPKWHFAIVRDEARNAAYEAALKRVVTSKSRVLDIGTGTGILAMMAARAGARTVIACEMNPAVADAAAEVVALNGLADRVQVVPKRSTTLDPETDMGGRADVLVSEIVSNDMLGEAALPVMADAVARLLQPQCRIIPAAGQVRVAPAWWAGLETRRLGEIAGFDLNPFNRLDRTPIHLKAGDPALNLRGPAADLFDFDFTSGGPYHDERVLASLPCDGRPVNGVVQWIRLQMDDEGDYENAPAPGAESCWAVLFHPLVTAMAATEGRSLKVHGAHDRSSVRIWVDLEA